MSDSSTDESNKEYFDLIRRLYVVSVVVHMRGSADRVSRQARRELLHLVFIWSVFSRAHHLLLVADGVACATD